MLQSGQFRTESGLRAYRRLWIARYRLRGMSLSEIAEALPRPPSSVINPRTGKPYSERIIYGDLLVCRKAWESLAAEQIAEHRAAQLAELREYRRVSWEAGDLGGVRQGILLEARLLGTLSPTLVAPTDPTGKVEYGSGLTDDERLARICALLGTVSASGDGSSAALGTGGKDPL